MGIKLIILSMLAVGVVFTQVAVAVKTERATFAGGCFWCMEPPFEKLDGVIEVTSGYCGGTTENPTYEEVSMGTTGHIETVEVIYDPEKVSYEELLNVFWRQIDPTDALGQFADRGHQYTSAIFFHNEEQKVAALASKQQLIDSCRFKNPIVTLVKAASDFYEAEDYHQDYYKKSAIRYKVYRYGSGRDAFLEDAWKEAETSCKVKLGAPPARETTASGVKSGKYTRPNPAEMEEIKKTLTELQYEVTQKEGTERAFSNEYWDNKREGIYVDIVSGEPLFSSTHKYKSGTGWPSFTEALEAENLVVREDKKLFSTRTELRSHHADSHLGHVFNDGPRAVGADGPSDAGGQRYCINSAALRFIPKEDLEKEGYGEYMGLFK